MRSFRNRVKPLTGKAARAVPGRLKPLISVGAIGQVATASAGIMAPAGGGGSTGAAADFNARKTAPGVVRWFDFDTTAQLGYVGDPVGVNPNFGTFVNSGANIPTMPVIDTSVSASGGGSLRFDIVSGGNDSSAGQWYANFSPDLSVQFGAGQTFYVQWRQRFSQSFVDTYFLDTLGNFQNGIKQCIVGTGDTPGTLALSHSDLEVVTQSYHQHRFSRLYNDQDTISVPFEEPFGSDVKLQNAMPAPYCLYTAAGDSSTTSNVAVPTGCFGWVANEWMTFKLMISVGTENTSTRRFDNSTVRLWGAREGQASVLLLDWNPAVPGYFPLQSRISTGATGQRFGKVWLLPYMTGKSTTQAHPLCQTWYDELIISTQDIADPAPNYPAWRRSVLVKDTIGSIAGTANMADDGSIPLQPNGSYAAGKTAQMQGQCWDGAVMDENGARLIACADGGDKLVGQNGVFLCDLNQDAPKYTTRYAGINPVPYTGDGSNNGTQTPAPANSIFPDGTLRGHQTYDHQFYDETRNAVLMFYIAAPFGNISGHSDVTRAFYLNTNKYDSAADGTGPWNSSQLDTFGQRICSTMARDPRNGDVYMTSNSSFMNYWKNDGSPKGTFFPQFVSGLSQWNMRGACVDTKRNRLVYFMNGQMQQCDITTPTAITFIGSTTCTGLHTGAGLDDLAYLTYGPPNPDPLADQIGWYIRPIYDDINDRYILLTGDATPGHGLPSTQFPGYMWFISPAGVVTNRVSIPTPINGWNSRVWYNRKHRCLMWLTNFVNDISFMPLVDG